MLLSLDRVNGSSWSCLLNFVQAIYLCGLYDQAAAMAPLYGKGPSSTRDGSTSAAG